MARGTYYVQECPTCGRNLQVRIEYLGRDVICQHCQAKFAACDPSSSDFAASTSSSVLRRAEELIESATLRRRGS